MHSTVSFLAAACIGALIWVLSPMVTGHAEPWDANSAYYPLALSGGGVALGIWRPGNAAIAYLGVISGQLLSLLMMSGPGPFIGLALVFLAGFSLLLAFGAAVGAKVRMRYRGKRPDQDDVG